MNKCFLSLLFLLMGINSVFAQSPNVSTNITNTNGVKLSYSEKSNSIKGKSLIRFKEMLETKLSDKFKIELLDNKESYQKNEEIEATELGVINITAPSKEQIEKSIKIKELELFNLPFLINDVNDYKKIVFGQSGQDILNKINSSNNNIQAIGYLNDGPTVLISNQFIHNIKNFNKKNVMITESEINKLNFLSLGVNKIIPLNNDSYVINSDKIDIIETTLENLNNTKLASSFKFITESQFNYSINIVLVNKLWFNNLSTEIKEGLLKVIKETMLYNIDLLEKETLENKKNLALKGIKFYQLNEEEIKEFKKNTISIHNHFLNDINKNLLMKTYQEIKNK